MLRWVSSKLQWGCVNWILGGESPFSHVISVRWRKICTWAWWIHAAAVMAVGPRRGLNLRGNKQSSNIGKKKKLDYRRMILLHVGVQAATAQGWKLSPLGLLWWEAHAGGSSSIRGFDAEIAMPMHDFSINVLTRRCQGKGTWNKNPCSQCNGHGQANHRKKVACHHLKKLWMMIEESEIRCLCPCLLVLRMARLWGCRLETRKSSLHSSEFSGLLSHCLDIRATGLRRAIISQERAPTCTQRLIYHWHKWVRCCS